MLRLGRFGSGAFKDRSKLLNPLLIILKETKMNHSEETLDPQDWEATRALAHRMIDDAIAYVQTVRERPVWQAMISAQMATAVE